MRVLALPLADSTLLHGGHPAVSFEAFHWPYLAVSVLLVGGVGGLLYWYYGTHRSRPESHSGPD